MTVIVVTATEAATSTPEATLAPTATPASGNADKDNTGDYNILDMPVLVINTQEKAQVSDNKVYTVSTLSIYGCDEE